MVRLHREFEAAPNEPISLNRPRRAGAGQRHSGTAAQRHSGTAGQRDSGTEMALNILPDNITRMISLAGIKGLMPIIPT